VANLKIAILADKLTTTALSYEDNCTCYNITPFNHKFVFKIFKPDILFVESAWQGYRNSWKFKIASYPDHPKRSNAKLIKVVDYAKRLGIPTVFWNKEDGVHFDRFVDSAKHFEHIFTVDKNCIPKYQEVFSSKITVNKMMFLYNLRYTISKVLILNTSELILQVVIRITYILSVERFKI